MVQMTDVLWFAFKRKQKQREKKHRFFVTERGTYFSLSYSLFYQTRFSQWSFWPWLYTVFCSPSLSPTLVRCQSVPPTRAHAWRRSTAPPASSLPWSPESGGRYKSRGSRDFQAMDADTSLWVKRCESMHLMSFCLNSWRHRTTVLCHYVFALIYFILQQWLKATAQCMFFTNKYRSDSACQITGYLVGALKKWVWLNLNL